MMDSARSSTSAAPAASIRSATAAPSSVGTSAVPVSESRIQVEPSGTPTNASIASSSSPLSEACAATGVRQRASRVSASRNANDRETVGQLRGHVLGGVHGEVDLAGQQRLLDLLDEPRLVVRRGRRAAAALVAGGAYGDQLGAPADRVGHQPRPREP